MLHLCSKHTPWFHLGPLTLPKSCKNVIKMKQIRFTPNLALFSWKNRIRKQVQKQLARQAEVEIPSRSVNIQKHSTRAFLHWTVWLFLRIHCGRITHNWRSLIFPRRYFTPGWALALNSACWSAGSAPIIFASHGCTQYKRQAFRQDIHSYMRLIKWTLGKLQMRRQDIQEGASYIVGRSPHLDVGCECFLVIRWLLLHDKVLSHQQTNAISVNWYPCVLMQPKTVCDRTANVMTMVFCTCHHFALKRSDWRVSL